jgi:hypothetical protein
MIQVKKSHYFCEIRFFSLSISLAGGLRQALQIAGTGLGLTAPSASALGMPCPQATVSA